MRLKRSESHFFRQQTEKVREVSYWYSSDPRPPFATREYVHRGGLLYKISEEACPGNVTDIDISRSLSKNYKEANDLFLTLLFCSMLK